MKNEESINTCQRSERLAWPGVDGWRRVADRWVTPSRHTRCLFYTGQNVVYNFRQMQVPERETKAAQMFRTEPKPKPNRNRCCCCCCCSLRHLPWEMANRNSCDAGGEMRAHRVVDAGPRIAEPRTAEPRFRFDRLPLPLTLLIGRPCRCFRLEMALNDDGEAAGGEGGRRREEDMAQVSMFQDYDEIEEKFDRVSI